MTWSRDTARSYAEVGEQHHVAVLRPFISRLFGDLSGRRVLDFGCGPGRLAVALAEAGASEVVAVDRSSEMVEHARQLVGRQTLPIRDRISVTRGDEKTLGGLGGFDAVLSCLALMMSESAERLIRTGRSLVDAVRPNGRLVVVVTHPCFRQGGYETFHYDLPRDFDYWKSGSPYQVVVTPSQPDREAIAITDYHWTLGDYCDALIGHGAALTALEEVPATWRDDGTPDGPPAYLALCVDRTWS
jgi:SAM-dependent methyltransferase